MEFISGHNGREHEIRELFLTTFTTSEGVNEGKVIERFVTDLIETTDDRDLFSFSAYEASMLVGCIFFSRLTYMDDKRTVFIMSPVAVRTSRQNRGIGKKLIAFGLDRLRLNGIDVVFTYGDPNFYSRVGFRHVTESLARAPFGLTQPEGWLAQSLTKAELETLIGTPVCVNALNKPELW